MLILGSFSWNLLLLQSALTRPKTNLPKIINQPFSSQEMCAFGPPWIHMQYLWQTMFNKEFFKISYHQQPFTWACDEKEYQSQVWALFKCFLSLRNRFSKLFFIMKYRICIFNTVMVKFWESEIGSLKRHMRTVHEGRSDFECDECGKRFKSYQSMKVRILGHNYTRTLSIDDILIFQLRFIKNVSIWAVATSHAESVAVNYAPNRLSEPIFVILIPIWTWRKLKIDQLLPLVTMQ